MNKLRLISSIAIGLLLVDLALVGYIFWRGPSMPVSHEGPKRIIMERLHLDAAQCEAYEQLISGHRRTIREKEQAIMRCKNELYGTLLAPNAAKKDTLIQHLGQLQMDIETIHYAHFLDIQQLLRPDQQAYFEALVRDLSMLFAPGPGRRPGPGGPPESEEPPRP